MVLLKTFLDFSKVFETVGHEVPTCTKYAATSSSLDVKNVYLKALHKVRFY